MSTRSTIAYERDDGTIVGSYCHFDGYPGGVGREVQHLSYNQAVELVDGGAMSQPWKYYGDEGSILYQDRNTLRKEFIGDFVYLRTKDGWFVDDGYIEFGRPPFLPLEDVLNGAWEDDEE